MDPVNQDQQPITPPEPQAAPPAPQPMPITPVEPVTPPKQPVPPAPQPQYPVTNTAMGGAAPVQPGGKKSKTGLIIGLVAGGIGLVVLVIIAIVVVVSMLSVSKKDYLSAYNQYSELRKASFSVDTGLITVGSFSSGTDTSFKNASDEVKESLGKMEAENKKLSGLKAVKTGEGKELYTKLNTKLSSYMKYAGDKVVSMEKFRPAYSKCDEMSSTDRDTAAVKTALAGCVAALKSISDVPDADLKSFIETLAEQQEKLLAITEKIEAIKNPYGSQYDEYSALRKQVYEISSAVSDAGTDFRSNSNKKAKDVDFRDEAKALSDFLSSKAIGR